MKSGFSTASAVQRSKYHTISNNYVDSTGPKFLGKNTRTFINKYLYKILFLCFFL
jgi:hypothetical protein